MIPAEVELDGEVMTPEIDEKLWRQAVGRRLDDFESRLEENTTLTKRIDTNTADMVELFNSWKGAMKVLDVLGRVAKPLLAIGGLIAAMFAWKTGTGK